VAGYTIKTSGGRLRAASRQSGLVLPELLLTLALLAVLCALAVPGLAALRESMRLRATTEALRSSLHLARAEAFKRGGRVTLARIIDADGCQDDSVGQWRCGWKVFVDVDEDGQQNGAEELLQIVVEAGDVDVRQTSRRTALTVSPWGQFNGMGALGFQLQSRAAPSTVAAICVSAGGRIQTRPGAAGCSE